jgi:HAD superfamily hydrolase (TIGR01458 family)
MLPVDGLLLDIDGVLAVSWKPIPGSVRTIEWLRREGVPFRLVTNTTTYTRRRLAERLGRCGLDVRPDEIVTAVVATAEYLRTSHAGAKAFVLSDGDAAGDLDGVALVDNPDDADVVVLGGAGDDFSYATLNRIFRRLMDGAPLVGMHRNLYWRTAEGWELDSGAYLDGLEAAAGVCATICGKPAAAYFTSALELLGVPAQRAAMIGDDVTNDVLGAKAVGMQGVLVKTGKFRSEDLASGRPDVVLDSIADVPPWLRQTVSP